MIYFNYKGSDYQIPKSTFVSLVNGKNGLFLGDGDICLSLPLTAYLVAGEVELVGHFPVAAGNFWSKLSSLRLIMSFGDMYIDPTFIARENHAGTEVKMITFVDGIREHIVISEKSKVKYLQDLYTAKQRAFMGTALVSDLSDDYLTENLAQIEFFKIRNVTLNVSQLMVLGHLSQQLREKTLAMLTSLDLTPPSPNRTEAIHLMGPRGVRKV